MHVSRWQPFGGTWGEMNRLREEMKRLLLALLQGRIFANHECRESTRMKAMRSMIPGGF